MFTGIVVEQAEVRRARPRQGVIELEIRAPRVAKELGEGDSVAVNGVCLTATRTGRKQFTVQAVPETLARTTLGALRAGDRVNVELPLKISDRLGGHLVQGHVDGKASVIRIEEEKEEGARRIWFRVSLDLLRFMVPKGSVALDGVSLTIVEVGRTTFQVALIPHTLKVTTLASLEVGSEVNVEVDVVAKYVEQLVAPHRPADHPQEGP